MDGRPERAQPNVRLVRRAQPRATRSYALALTVTIVVMTVFVAAPLALITGIGMSPALSTRFKRVSKVLSIQEIVGMEGPVVTMQEIFRFRRTGTGKDGEVEGVYEATGVVPHVSERMELLGEDVTGLFDRPGERNGARR